MLITRVELENIKSYKKVDIAFRRGTTAISGSNGAGKTTLVEAIGYALFNHLPYRQDQFVREGEKYGRVVIHLIGGDDRPYIVERRCGAGARWFMTDQESTERLEQGADMQDRLHDLFGIDRERPLESLFKDALGVPQGTFTAIFLETATNRKKTFDALLQIEDYKTSSDYLLGVKHHYEAQMAVQRAKISELLFKTSELTAWRAQLAAAQQRDEQQKQQSVVWSQELSHSIRVFTDLKAQEHELEQFRQRFESCQTAHTNAQSLLERDEKLLQEAQTAQTIVTASFDDFQCYQQAERTVTGLRKDEQQRNKLLMQQAALDRDKVTIETKQRGLHGRLEEVAVARHEIKELAPLVERQNALENRRDDLRVKAKEHDTVMSEGLRLRDTTNRYRQQQDSIQQRIAAIKPLQPLAERLQEWSEALSQLQIQQNERRGKQLQVQEKREERVKKQRDYDTVSDRLRKVEMFIVKTEEHRQEAEEMPDLLRQRVALAARQNQLEGIIQGYVTSRAQSAGGQCPLLHQTCLNIKTSGQVSLESYFDTLLGAEHTELATVQGQQALVTQREQQIERFVEPLNKLEQYIDAQNNYSERVQQLGDDIAKLDREITGITQSLDALKALDQNISETKKSYDTSKEADRQVHSLVGLYEQVQQYQEQIQKGDADLIELRTKLGELKGSDVLLRQTEDELAALNDPYSRSKAQQHIVEQEGMFTRQLQEQAQRLQETLLQMHLLDEQLMAYANLDNAINQQEAIRLSSLAGHESYLRNEDAAHLLAERERVYQEQADKATQAIHDWHTAGDAFHEADAAFQPARLQMVRTEIDRLNRDITALQGERDRNQRDIEKVTGQIALAEVFLQELEVAQAEQQTLEDLNTMMTQFRGYIKEAAPHVLKAMLSDISAEANRIFGEIMGDRTAQLSWQNDYEIVLRRQSTNRTFAQLSGGEQMSAALAIRLALLKKLSTLNLAFFDEPTQNMDEMRRMNLAEQIRRVRGFDQLLVISHDDTFEQGLDSIVRLSKEHGETRTVSDEEVQQERLLNYAS